MRRLNLPVLHHSGCREYMINTHNTAGHSPPPFDSMRSELFRNQITSLHLSALVAVFTWLARTTLQSTTCPSRTPSKRYFQTFPCYITLVTFGQFVRSSPEMRYSNLSTQHQPHPNYMIDTHKAAEQCPPAFGPIHPESPKMRFSGPSHYVTVCACGPVLPELLS